MVTGLCLDACGTKELHLTKQRFLPVDSTMDVARRAKALEKNNHVPEFDYATRRSSGA